MRLSEDRFTTLPRLLAALRGFARLRTPGDQVSRDLHEGESATEPTKLPTSRRPMTPRDSIMILPDRTPCQFRFEPTKRFAQTNVSETLGRRATPN